MGVEVAIPLHTRLQERTAKLKVAVDVANVSGPIDVAVDSTGLKVYDECEWKVRKHGVGKRRALRKLHLAVDPATHTFVAHTLTQNNEHDAHQVEPLWDQVPLDIATFYGDGAYDQWKVYETHDASGVDVIIPPRKNANIKQPGNLSAAPLPRDECVRQIRREGHTTWKKSIDYHRRSLADTAIGHMKTSFGDKLANRKFVNQVTEPALRCKMLNLFDTLCMPIFIWS